MVYVWFDKYHPASKKLLHLTPLGDADPVPTQHRQGDLIKSTEIVVYPEMLSLRKRVILS